MTEMDPSIPLKLLLATLLGGLIGIEREIREKPAGLRTNILICIGSTIIFLFLCRWLHRRDKLVAANRSATTPSESLEPVSTGA